MGQEQSQITPPSSQPSTNIAPSAPKIKSDYEILIVVRGTRRTGKTTLLKRMKNEPFTEEYTATPSLEATEIPWRSPDGEIVNVKVWDCPEKALLPTTTQEKQQFVTDATTVDTFKRTDGLVLLIDSRYSDTAEQANRIISEAPENLPVCVFSNFMDNSESSPVIPDILQENLHRFYFIPGSLLTNQGLEELSKWIQIPLQHKKRQTFLDLYKSADVQLLDMLGTFNSQSARFVDIELARKYAPVKRAIPSQSRPKGPDINALQTPSNTPSTDNKPPAHRTRKQNVPDSFFDDDEEVPDKPIEALIGSDDEEDEKPNPAVVIPKGKKATKTGKKKVVKKGKKKAAKKAKDDFFGGEEEVPDQSLPDDDDDGPNPAVLIQPKKPTISEAKSAKNEVPVKAEKPKKPVLYSGTDKPVIITAVKPKPVDEDADDFFGDDDDDEIVDVPIDELVESDDDDEDAPNPLVQQSAKPVFKVPTSFTKEENPQVVVAVARNDYEEFGESTNEAESKNDYETFDDDDI